MTRKAYIAILVIVLAVVAASYAMSAVNRGKIKNVEQGMYEAIIDTNGCVVFGEYEYLYNTGLVSNRYYEKMNENVIARIEEKVNNLVAEQDYTTALNFLFQLSKSSEARLETKVQSLQEMVENTDAVKKQRAEEALAQKKKDKIAAEKAAEDARKDLARRKQEGVSIGMTKQEVLESNWGKPDDINKTTTAYSIREQWVYGNRNYLYFEDGILTSIQN